jgi:hypothetical protein
MANKNPNKATRFKKGHKAPGPGRHAVPKPITDELRRLMGETKFLGRKLAGGKTVAQMLAERWIVMAKDNPTAMRDLMARMEGPVPIEINGQIESGEIEGVRTRIVAILGTLGLTGGIAPGGASVDSGRGAGGPGALGIERSVGTGTTLEVAEPVPDRVRQSTD